MPNLLMETETEQSLEARIVHVGDQAISFERFLEMAEGRFVELERGVIQEIHLLRRHDAGYKKTVIKEGPVLFAVLPHLTLQAEWILCEPRPNVRAMLNALFPA